MAVTGHRLPRSVALAAALLYGLTLNWGLTASNLPLAATSAGWNWQPALNQPVAWLLTLPLRLLPAAWMPAALNLLFALCGAATLGLLARSVELIPWDCPPPSRKQWIKFLPVLLACGVCGLEFNFWREATNATGAMLNQLLLAAAIWCLLEYRAGKDSRWLNAAAVIWGLGMAQNWVLLLNLPLFVAALIWLRKRRFFKGYFLLRMTLFGLAGFSLYALLPLVNGLNPHSPLSFSAAWLATLKNTKSTFWLLHREFFSAHRLMTLVLVLYFLLPTLPALVRLQDRGSNNKSKVERLQLWIYRLVRGALLLACLWLAFEPVLGPQQILIRQFGVSQPLLSFDYLNALGIGFLSGNLLFALQVRPERGKLRGLKRKINSWRRRSLPIILTGASGLILAALVVRNAPAILSDHRQSLATFGTLAASSLPAGGGILVGNNPEPLAVVQAALAQQSKNGGWQIVQLASLASPHYRAVLERQQPLGWLTEQNRHELKPQEQFRLLEQLARAKNIFFLQPGPGQMLFEQFYAEPAGLVAELKTYAPAQVSAPPLAPAALAAGENFWDDAWQVSLAALRQPEREHSSAWTRFRGKLSRMLALEPQTDLQPRWLAEWYSIALDQWGVELQRSGRLAAAQQRFEQALALATNNDSAAINLECNSNLQAGRPLNLTGLDDLSARFKDLPHLTQFINRGGPIDQPAVCFLLGRYCEASGWPRQAVQQLERARTLAPAALPPDFALAEIYLRHHEFEKVFASVQRLRTALATLPADQSGPLATGVDLLEAETWMSQTNLAQARRCFESILQQHPQDPSATRLVLNTYMNFADYTDALKLLNQRLASEPNNAELLNDEAGILLRVNQASNAIVILDRLLVITNAPTVRLNLALAYFQNQDLPAAETEYHQLEADPPDVFLVHFGLANIAERRHDTSLAIRHLEICLTNAPAGSLRWQAAHARLEALKP